MQSTQYTKGLCVCCEIDSESGLPIFGEIKLILSQLRESYFVLEKLETVDFSEHYHSYELERRENTFCLIDVENLLDYHPYVLHKCASSSALFRIVVKYDLS